MSSGRAVVRGAGSIGQRHVSVLRGLGMDVSSWPLRGRAGHGSESTVDGPEAYAGAALVVIATDTARHVHDAILALDSGAACVLVEKPVAPTAADARVLAAHSRADAVTVAAPLRALEGFREMARVAAALPGPLSAYVHCQSWLPDWRPHRDYRDSYSARADEGGVLRDLIHEIDYATVLFGTPNLVGAVLEAAGPLDMAAEQAASLVWSTHRATVLARLDYISRPPARGAWVTGTNGSAAWDIAAATVTASDAGGHATTTRYPADLDRNAAMATQARALLDPSVSDPTSRLASGAPATLAEGIAAIEFCDAARAWAHTCDGRPG